MKIGVIIHRHRHGSDTHTVMLSNDGFPSIEADRNSMLEALGINYNDAISYETFDLSSLHTVSVNGEVDLKANPMWLTIEMMESPTWKWEDKADHMGNELLEEVAKQADAICVRTGELYGYIDQRYGSGCGDQGHQKAEKNRSKLRRAIRKVLGYTIL